jgi:hypothetical protein
MCASDGEPRDERSPVIRLALAALVSWAATLRLLTILLTVLVVLATIALLAVLLLPIDIEIGPLHLTRRSG